ncbi:hypothetical protein [Bradyrhizobium genosp. P]|uniref:hypothetical protein n=1 Tax=Bradyrhizobium genosp. P TaxID=83641 RepID=UPI003CFABC71
MNQALRDRGVAAWEFYARQLHTEASHAADFGDLPTSLMLRRCAFEAEQHAAEWQNSELFDKVQP